MSIVMFILGLILLGLLALTAHSISGMFVAMNDLSLTSRERQIDLIWESGISSLMVQAGPNGEYVAPLGAILTNSTGTVIGHTIPSTTPGPRLNTKGYAPRYCALGRTSLSGGSSQTVTLSIGSTYSVETVNVGGIDYVTRSNDVAGMQRGNTSVLGFIISPLEKSDSLSCANIAYDAQTGAYSTPGIVSKVIPLFGANGGTLSAAEGINRSNSQFIDGSLYGSLNDALAPYLNNPPRRLILNLPDRDSGYRMISDLSFGRQTASDAELVITGAGAEKAEISGRHSFTVSNARLVLSNVALQASLAATDATVNLASSSVGSVAAKHSELILDGTNEINGKISLDNSKVDQDANLVLNYASTTTGAVDLVQSSWRARAGTISVNGSSQYGVWLDQSSRMSLQGETLQLQGTFGQGIRVGFDSVLSSIDSTMSFAGSATSFLDVKGRAVLTGGLAYSSGSLSNGAVLRDGASILLDNSQQWFSTGITPQVGVNDLGALSVAGTSAIVGGGVCWQGYLFTESTAGQVTNNNNENMQGRVTASWSCSQ